MKAVRRAITRSLILSLAFTAALPLGGVALGLGIAYGVTAVWVVGVVLLVLGFYGCPFCWAACYAPKLPLGRLVSAVTEEHIYTAKELSEHLGIPEKNVRSMINTCINKKYLVGFKRENGELAPNHNVAYGDRERVVRCENCGAVTAYKGVGGARCPYCGSALDLND